MAASSFADDTLKGPEAARKAMGRSATTNGNLLPGVDGRSTWMRRVRDLIELHETDLGGEANCSQAERSIIRRAAILTVELERLEQRFALDEAAASAAAIDCYQRWSSTLRRLLESLGLRRRAVDVTPTLDRYLASRPMPETVEDDADARDPLEPYSEGEAAP